MAARKKKKRGEKRFYKVRVCHLRFYSSVRQEGDRHDARLRVGVITCYCIKGRGVHGSPSAVLPSARRIVITLEG